MNLRYQYSAALMMLSITASVFAEEPARAIIAGNGVSLYAFATRTRQVIAPDEGHARFVAATSEFVFWSDSVSGTVSRSRHDGSEMTHLFMGLSGPRGIAVSTSRLLFAETGTSRIYSSDFDGTDLLTISSSTYRPAGMEVHGDRLYWTDDYRDEVRSMRLDGSQNTLIHLQASDADADNIAVDDRHIYWSDVRRDEIVRIRHDGSEYRVIVNSPNPTGLAAYNGDLYWVDNYTDQLMLLSSSTGASEVVFDTAMGHSYGLVVLVPEPASVALLAVPCVVLAYRRR